MVLTFESCPALTPLAPELVDTGAVILTGLVSAVVSVVLAARAGVAYGTAAVGVSGRFAACAPVLTRR